MTPQTDLTPAEPAAPVTPPAPGLDLPRIRRILSGDIRPDDYLPVTPEVRAGVERDMDFVRARSAGRPIGPGVELRQLHLHLLERFDRDVACIENENGIIVLVEGIERIGEFLRLFPENADRPGVVIVSPWNYPRAW